MKQGYGNCSLDSIVLWAAGTGIAMTKSTRNHTVRFRVVITESLRGSDQAGHSAAILFLLWLLMDKIPWANSQPAVQKQTAVTAYFSSEQLLLFAFVLQQKVTTHESWLLKKAVHGSAHDQCRADVTAYSHHWSGAGQTTWLGYLLNRVTEDVPLSSPS